MSENSIGSVRNGVIASIIGGIILLVILDSKEYLVRFLSWLWFGALWCWEALISSYSLPGWVWIIVFLFVLVGVMAIFQALKSLVDKPEYMAYVEDWMFGAKWRWKWMGSQGISELWCFCPRCEAMLVYQEDWGSGKTDFICENCGRSTVATISGGNKDYALGAVKREIDRRIRTGEYKKKLNN